MKSIFRHVVAAGFLVIAMQAGLVQAQSPEGYKPKKPAMAGWDAGLSIGSAHSLADIGGTRSNARILFYDAQWQTSGVNLGIFGRYRFNELFALNTVLNYAQIGGADTLSPVQSGRYWRKHYFNNHITELAFTGEVYLPNDYLKLPLEAYAYLGFGIFYHNPDLVVGDPNIFQAASFSKIQPVVPMGLGLHYTLPNNFRIGYSLGWRMTFTDYVDAFTEPNSQGNDSYFFSAFNIGYFFR